MVAPGPYRAPILKALAETLVAITDRMAVSSLHITFSGAEEWAALGALGLQQRRGIQFHWENDGYSTFEDFLAALKQSKRKNIRQVRS
jgi:predicted N-acyltransferase